MKKIFPILIITLSLNLTPAKAQYSVACVNCMNESTAVWMKIKQAYQAGIEGINQVANVEKTLKSNVTDPIMNALLSSAIDTTKQSLTSWINGGFQGNPLVAINPETYLNNIGKHTIRIKIGEIAKSNDKNKGAVIKTIVQSERYNQLSVVAKTQLTKGSSIRKDVCTDARLGGFAYREVFNTQDTSDSDFSRNVSLKKKELYDRLCPLDKEEALINCYENDKSGLCQSWTATLDPNPNNTTDGHIAEVARLTKEEADRKVEVARSKMDGAYLPKEDANGKTEAPAAITKEVDKILSTKDAESLFTKSGSDLTNSLLNKIIKSSLSFLTTQTRGALAQSGINSEVADNLVDINGLIAGNLNGVNVDQIITSGLLQNGTSSLSNMPVDMTDEEHTALIGSMLNRITLDLSSLSKMNGAYDGHLSDVNNYISQINNSSLSSCYTGLLNGGNSYGGNTVQYKRTQITAHYDSLIARYQSNINGWRTNLTNRINYLNGIKTALNNKIERANDSISLANQTIQTLVTSKNKAEISDTYFNKYNSVADVPPAGSEGLVEPRRMQLQNEVETYNTNTLTPMTTSCNQITTIISNDMAEFMASLDQQI